MNEELLEEYVEAFKRGGLDGLSEAMRRIDPETIKLAAANIKDFGTALSGIEVAQEVRKGASHDDN